VSVDRGVLGARAARGCPCPWIAPWLIALMLVGGCGGSTAASGRADASIRHDVLRGVRQIRATHDRRKLHAELVVTLARLRRARATTTDARRGRVLAVQGFEAMLKGVESELDFEENDSGEVAAATRDAVRADRYLTVGANRLRGAGKALGIQIGELAGH
jgi:hypothetical protein